jgi:hypothetical protein
LGSDDIVARRSGAPSSLAAEFAGEGGDEHLLVNCQIFQYFRLENVHSYEELRLKKGRLCGGGVCCKIANWASVSGTNEHTII